VYIGKTPIVGNFQKCDAITVVNGQAAYTLQVSSTNVTPESANHMLVSLNGILQAPVTSFSVSGSTLTFASNLATGDVIDFVMLLGNVLDLGVPSDDTVGAAQIKDDLISGTTALASEPADTDEFLVSDAGTLKRIDYSLIKGGGSMTKIANADYGSAVSTFSYTNCFTSDYSVYKFHMFDIDAAADNDELEIKFLDSGGSVVGDWRQVSTEIYKEQTGTDSGTRTFTDAGSDWIRCANQDMSASTTQPSHLEMTIYLPYESKYTTVHQRFFLRADNSYNHYFDTYAFLSSTTSLRSMTVYMDSGTNFASYKSTLYGLTR